MKRTIILILSLAVFLTFFGCSADNNTTETTNAPQTTSAVSTSEKKVKKELKGIDVSSYSGDIDWKAVKKSGVQFAMIRIGGRGFAQSGALYADKKAAYNIVNAQKNGIKTGVYFFSQAMNEYEAGEEADFVLKQLGNTKLDLPIAYDIEKLDETMTRIANLSRKDAVKNSGVFSEKLKKAGYDTVVYIKKGKFMNAEDYSPREVWFADYTEPYDNPYYMLQYSKEGKVDGINGTVDLDIMYTE